MRDNMDPSVRGVQDMRRLLNVPPLAAIPVIITRADRRRHLRIVGGSWLGATTSLVTAAVLVHLFVRPLDVMWLSLLHRFGM
jgi:hypothetical protein